MAIRCADCDENEARYIDQFGRLVCGICPLKHENDSIKIADVPKLLAWARRVLRRGVIHRADLEIELRDIVQRAPVIASHRSDEDVRNECERQKGIKATGDLDYKLGDPWD